MEVAIHYNRGELRFVGETRADGTYDVILGIGPDVPYGDGIFSKGGYSPLEVNLSEHAEEIEDYRFRLNVELQPMN